MLWTTKLGIFQCFWVINETIKRKRHKFLITLYVYLTEKNLIFCHNNQLIISHNGLSCDLKILVNDWHTIIRSFENFNRWLAHHYNRNPLYNLKLETSLWKQSTFHDPISGFPQNEVWGTRAEMSQHVTTQICVVLLIGSAVREISFNQSEAPPRSG